VDRRALVAALRAVHGVADADVDAGPEGGLGTLRLDLEPGVDEAEVASQVSQVLREQFGLGVDADRVELLESETEQDVPEEQPLPEPEPVSEEPPPLRIHDEVTALGPPEPRTSTRPAIAKMHLVSTGLDVTASVTLSSGARTAVGEARGMASQSGLHRAVAHATLRAVEQLAGEAVRLDLDALELTPLASERTVVVMLTMLSSRGSERLTGAAVVRDDVRQAVIRATLDAVNRRLELLLVEV
jgi:hypothetical protein